MNNILQSTLKRLGVKDVRDLTPQERQTYDQFEEVIKRQVTVDDLKKMLPVLRGQLEDRLLDPENNTERDVFLKARIRNLKDIEAFITAPERNRRALEANLKTLIRSN